ncbi:MAG: carbohydrate ABC transporter permease [Bacilli bacterium]
MSKHRTKEPVYLSSPQSDILQKKLLANKKEQEALLQKVKNQYITSAQKRQENPKLRMGPIFALSRKMARIELKLQRINLSLLKLSENKYLKLNFFQKIRFRFSLLSYHKQKVVFGILFLLPWIIGFCVFFAYPLGTSLWWSLNKMTIISGGGYSFEFYSFGNYRDLFVSETLAGSTISEVLTSSVIDILINLPTILIFSLFIAVLLNTKFKGHQLVKAIFFIPVVYNMTVINNTLTGTFGRLFDSGLDQSLALSAQFSNFLMQVGIGNGLVSFLTDAVGRIFTIVNMSGIQILIFIAALQSIPAHLYEAAKVEGATKYEMFWKITIPMISPMVLTAAVFTIVDSFATSEIIQFMTVNSQGTTMAVNQPGLYSAISVVYFLANALIIILMFLALRKQVFYYDK